MQNLRNPKWLLIINTLPIIVLISLFYSQYTIIHTLLDKNSIQLWKNFGLTLGILGLLTACYAIFLTFKRKEIRGWFGIVALFSFIPFIYIYNLNYNDFVPFSIPQWMVSSNLFLYVGTFLMPTLIYSLFILVSSTTSGNKEHKSLVNFLFAIGVPLGVYLFVMIILPMGKIFDYRFSEHIFIVAFIVATLFFLFFLIRSVFILASNKGEHLMKYQLAWKIPISLVLPLLGLSFNNGHFFTEIGENVSGMFGDFNNPWFYILTILNAGLICISPVENKNYRLLIFAGKCITFSYSLYFFLVFLPFLPLSVVAIIVIGAGFLMLAPLLLFVIHLFELSKDFNYLTKKFPKIQVIGILLIGFLVIPTCITLTYLNDKKVLNETLSFIYCPDYSKHYDIDKHSIKKTLDVVTSYKDYNNNGDDLFGQGVPYLSSYFNWLVLDNLTLSDAKINKIEKVFFGKSSFKIPTEIDQKDSVIISKIATRSSYDKSQKAWKSWVDLELSNKTLDVFNAVYTTTIDLPDGCWISDYYLYVGKKKEYGILAEKKAAMWIYSQIRNENRDPGILHYLTGNKVRFKVFPFTKYQKRKTGIEFLHKEPITLTIDNQKVELGNKQETRNEKIETENIAYVSVLQKQQLKEITRKPYFHFLVDISENKKKNTNAFIKRIDKVVKENIMLSENAKISYVSSYVTTSSLDNNWKSEYKKQVCTGGFNLDLAIKTNLFNAYKDNTKSYPVFVVVTDKLSRAVLDNDFADFEFAFPENNEFFLLTENGYLKAHSLIDNPLSELPEINRECMFCETVLEYKFSNNSKAYLPNNNEPSILIKKNAFEISGAEVKEKNWLSALKMQGQWAIQTLHPEISEKEWLNLVKNSFTSKVMSPVTSYLVVENEAQKAMLIKKQKEALSGNKLLDLGEDTQRMSEPGLLLVSILLAIILWYRKKWKSRSTSNID